MGNIIHCGSCFMDLFGIGNNTEARELDIPGKHDNDQVDGVVCVDNKCVLDKNIKLISDYLKPLVFVNFKGQASGTDTDSNEEGEVLHIGVYLKLLDSVLRSHSADATQFSSEEEKMFIGIFEKIGQKRHEDNESKEECLNKLTSDLKRFEKIYRERTVKNPDSPLSEPLHHENYWGTRQQLLAAKVICDWLSEDDQPPMDPVFGVLLNPTAGRVGPGDTGWFHNILYDNSGAMAHHSAVHDAFGYLITYHEIGPGYNYMYRSFFKKDNPLAGQISGIDFWDHYIDEIQPKVKNSENLIFL